MNGPRAALGADDVTDAELERMVADLWGVDAVRLVDSMAAPVDYLVPSMLTAGRTWVSGTADAGDGHREFRLFVKHVHHWRHSPMFDFVPPEIREFAIRTVPWRAEVLAYRSDLAERLPEGLTMPRALKVEDLPDEHAVLWLEAITPVDRAWDRAAYGHAAHLLGQLSGSPAVAPLAALDPMPWHIDYFVQGRLGNTVLPFLADDATWQHPLMATHFAPHRRRLTDVVAELPRLASEFAALPAHASHGDACPNNLLPREDGGFALIDFGFWRPQPVGFDLSQLLVGEIQVGRENADDLPERAAEVLRAYHEGLSAEGNDLTEAALRRSHAVCFMLFNGLPSPPVETLAQPESEATHHVAAQRARVCEYALDLIDETR